MASQPDNNAGGSNAAAGWTQGFNRLVKSVQTKVNETQENQRKAKEAKEIGKIWDPKEKDWVFYYLDQEVKQTTEALQTLQKDYQEKHGKKPPNTATTASMDDSDEPKVKDRLYYDWLEVRTDATEGVIRKAYFKLAKKYHPDRAPEGLTPEEAQTKFHHINVAYQVLSNPTARERYDKDGPAAETPDKEGGADANMDPMVFFHVLFASEIVEPYIGELWLATTSNNVFSEATSQAESKTASENDKDAPVDEAAAAAEEEARMEFLQEQSRLQQTLRQAQCAQYLRKRLSDYRPENPNVFAQSAKEEAEKIVAQASTPALGALYCQTLGRSWQNQAETFLGKYGQAGDWWTGPLAGTRQTATNVSTNLRLVGAGMQAALAGSRAMQSAQNYQESQVQQQQQEADKTDAAAANAEDAARKDPNQAEAQLAEALNQSLPSFLKLAWTMNQRDIQQTVKGTCTKLFDDAGVPLEDRFVRARAVRLLGQTFLKAGEKAVPNARQVLFRASSEEIQHQLAIATMTTMAKAQGQEVTPDDYANMRQQLSGMQAAGKEDDAETKRV